MRSLVGYLGVSQDQPTTAQSWEVQQQTSLNFYTALTSELLGFTISIKYH